MGGPALVFWSERTQNIATTRSFFEKIYRKRLVDKKKKKQGRRPSICILLRTGSKDILCSRSHSGLDLLIASLSFNFGFWKQAGC